MNISEFIKDVPVYQELYGALLNPNLTLDDLKKLPELSKKHVSKNFPNNWMTKDLKKVVDEEDYEFMTTSGTTDDRMMLIRPKNWWFEVEKRLYSYLKKIIPEYIDMQSKAILTTAVCSNTLCYKEVPPFEKRIVNGILHLNITQDPNKWTKQDIQRMADEIDEFKPQCFQADPLYLSVFFKLLKKYNVKLPDYKPNCLILTYEFCPKKCLEIIKSFWDIPTHIIYGTTEAGFMFYQCPKGNFHWMDDETYLNFKPIENKPNVFELLITSFRNPYMPFMKYNTRDLVYLDTDSKCSCSDSNLFIKQFMGRSKDITYSASNKVITLGDIDNQLSKLENNILAYKLDFNYDKKLIFRFTIFDDKDLKSDQLNEIKTTLNDLYENLYEIELIREEEILPAPSGKFDIIERKSL